MLRVVTNGFESLERRVLLANPGDLDTAFGSGGIDRINHFVHGVAMAVQSDGKIIEANTATYGGVRNLLVDRLNTDGSLDPSFARNGQYIQVIGGDFRDPGVDETDVAIDSHGRVVVVAGSELLRFTSGGVLDTTFGAGDGIVNSATPLTDLVLQSDDSILAGGGNIVRRYAPSGAIDSTFASAGAFDLNTVLGNSPGLEDLSLSPAGGLVIVGNSGPYDGGSGMVDVLRLQTDGTPDHSFGTSGLFQTSDQSAWCCAVESDGGILVGGYNGLLRVNPDGTMDDAFGTGGLHPLNNSPAAGWVYALGVQPDGKIIAAEEFVQRFTDYSASGDYGVLRLDAEGQPDTTFSADGVSLYGSSDKQFGDSVLVTAVAVDPQDRVLVGGVQIDPATQTSVLAIERLVGGDVANNAAIQLTSTGRLVLNGTDAVDSIAVNPPSQPGGATILNVMVDDNELQFPASAIKRIYVDAGAGNDEVIINDLVSATVLAQSGNDYISVANPVGELDGGPGNDLLIGGNFLGGGKGNDTMRTSNPDATISGGLGTDTVDFSSVLPPRSHPTRGMTITLDGVANDGLPGGAGNVMPDVEYVVGTPENDEIVGNDAGSLLFGGAGADTIVGGNGNDTISGDDGNDVLNGGSGNDKIHGGDGNDTIIGGRGHDRLYGDGGDDQIIARDHLRDTLYGGDGNDQASVNDSRIKDLFGEIETLI